MPSQPVDAMSTRCPAFFRASPYFRASAFAPTISTPVGSGSAMPSARAIVRPVSPCITTVPIMIVNTSGTRSSAPSYPMFSRRSANKAETAAATIPRGNIQPRYSRSRQFSSLPMELANARAGPAMNCRNISIASDAAPRPTRALSSMRAARRIKRPATSTIARLSLKSSMSSRSSPRMLACQVPIIVTASKPDSA